VPIRSFRKIEAADFSHGNRWGIVLSCRAVCEISEVEGDDLSSLHRVFLSFTHSGIQFLVNRGGLNSNLSVQRFRAHCRAASNGGRVMDGGQGFIT
jgi:hypothetical protein